MNLLMGQVHELARSSNTRCGSLFASCVADTHSSGQAKTWTVCNDNPQFKVGVQLFQGFYLSVCLKLKVRSESAGIHGGVTPAVTVGEHSLLKDFQLGP
jgi:hypothetical protein